MQILDSMSMSEEVKAAFKEEKVCACCFLYSLPVAIRNGIECMVRLFNYEGLCSYSGSAEGLRSERPRSVNSWRDSNTEGLLQGN